MIWGAMQINRGGCYPPRPLACMILHIIRKTHSIFYYSFKICKFLTTLPPRRLSANHLPLSYPGCQRLFMRGFRFREKTSGTQGTSFWVRFQNLQKMLYLADTPQNVDDIHRALFWHILAFVRSVLIKKFSFFLSSDSRKLFRHFFKVYFCINISVAAPLPESLLFYFGTISHTFTFQIR